MAEMELRTDDGGIAADPHIPTLQTVLGPASMTEHLRRFLPDRCASVTQLRIRVLKRHRKRCTFEAQWTGQNATRALIGKVYAEDRRDVYDAMGAIQRSGFGSDEAYSIPEPIAYVPELRLLLLEKIPGPRVKQVLLAGTDDECTGAAERCALWLTRFQVLASQLGPTYGVADVLDSLDDWSRPFDAAGDVLAEKSRRLRVRLAAAADRLAPIEWCASHGEYTCGQVLLADLDTRATDADWGRDAAPRACRTVTCDWDGYNVADPCRDVACFFVDLKRVGYKNPDCAAAFERAADVFLRTYLSCQPRTAANLPFYTAARCLRLAHKDIEREAADRAEFMLDLGLGLLDQPFAVELV